MADIFKPKLVVFDIDNTLTESRTLVDKEMGELLCELLSRTKVSAISGESLKQFCKQLVNGVPCTHKFNNFYLLPTCGAELYRWGNNDWDQVYTTNFSEIKKQKVIDAISKVVGITPSEIPIYIEDKGPQITYAGLGIDAPLSKKSKWDTDHKKRKTLIEKLKPFVPGVQMNIGGTTSIDFTEEGIDKAYGVKRILEILKIAPDEILFIGDALYAGGNDNAVVSVGTRTRSTSGPEETKEIIRDLIRAL